MRLSILLALGLAVAVPLGLAGCSSPDPKLYTAAAIPGVPQGGGPRVVRVRDVGIARYLQRPEIVRSTENYRLEVMANDWWGEPPAAMLSRVLIEALAQRLPGSSIYGESGAVSARPDATVELNIQRLDEDSDGNLILIGQGSVVFEASRMPPAVQSFRLTISPPQSNVAGEVAAISTAMAQVADQLAMALRRAPGV